MDGGHDQIMMLLGEMRSDIKTIKEQTIKTNGRVNGLESKVQLHSDFILTIKSKIALVSGMLSLLWIVAWEYIKKHL